MTIRLIHDDCLDAMVRLAGAGVHFDSCVTDSPYHLTSIVKRFGAANSAPAKFGSDGAFSRASAGFMGKTWDGGDIAFNPETWSLVKNVMKPGAFLLAFGGTRTFHRMTVAIEDAGFEIRDCLMWMYGQGMPKSHNQKGDWDGWGTGLKPAWEPIIMARKPLIGTVAKNLAQHGTGAINIEGCRVGNDERLNQGASSSSIGRRTRVEQGYRHDDGIGPGSNEKAVIGRWPANVLHDGSDEVVSMFPDARGQIAASVNDNDRRKTQNVYGTMSRGGDGSSPRDNGGSAARFFYAAKANKEDRAGSGHPTVKPVNLLQYLVRLVTPPGGHVLDPFSGSGTTGAAALAEGMRATLIEREDEYAADIRRRFGLEEEAA